MKKVKIVGATGYAGGETARILISHPEVELVSATYDGSKPVLLTDYYPQLRGLTELMVGPIEESSKVEDDLDLVFMAVPDNVAHRLAPAYLEKSVPVIDLSGDFRFANAETHRTWYGFDVDAGLLKRAVYGMPELFREKVRRASLIANPGCYPTSAILGLVPALRASFVDTETVICDAKSGVSGAGRNPNNILHFPERNENFSAYKIASHRHAPEIETYASEAAQKDVRITFVPHLIPISRGILTTLYADLLTDATAEQVDAEYRKFYANEKFVRVLPRDAMPSVNTVQGTNYCDLHISVDEHTNRLIVVSVIDNLVKGASGQAVQNMNIILGLEETAGLLTPGLYI